MNRYQRDAAWTKVWDHYYEAFTAALRQKSGRPDATIWEDEDAEDRFRGAVRATTYLFNEAETDDDFFDALHQMREVLEMALMTERGIT